VTTNKELERDPSHVQQGYMVLWINEVTPGHVHEYIEISKKVLPFYETYGVDVIGVWVGVMGAKSNQVLFLIEYHDVDRMNRLYADPEFVRLAAEAGVENIRSNTGWLLNPVDMAPLKFKLT